MPALGARPAEYRGVMFDRLSRSRAVTVIAAVFFVGYVGLLILAGAWGAFGPVRLDMRWLFDLDVDELDGGSAVDLSSQYRFLRGIELGFGIVAARHWRAIFHERRAGTVFLALMSLGVAARVAGLIWEGSPSWPFWFFLISEAVGAVAIWLAARGRWTSA
jgi:hypothetical protein